MSSSAGLAVRTVIHFHSSILHLLLAGMSSRVELSPEPAGQTDRHLLSCSGTEEPNLTGLFLGTGKNLSLVASDEPSSSQGATRTRDKPWGDVRHLKHKKGQN